MPVIGTFTVAKDGYAGTIRTLTLNNGWLVMLGALGAVTATGPADLMVAALGWRCLFALLAVLSALAALLILLAVPDKTTTKPPGAAARQAVSLSTIYRDPRFWRLAPLSTLGIGTTWSLQGLWAAPWLRDVAGFDRASVVQHLAVMAVALSASALLLGAVADRLRRLGIRTEAVLAATLALSMAAGKGSCACGGGLPAGEPIARSKPRRRGWRREPQIF